MFGVVGQNFERDFPENRHFLCNKDKGFLIEKITVNTFVYVHNFDLKSRLRDKKENVFMAWLVKT